MEATMATKAGLKAVRFVDGAINTAILGAILLLFAFGVFALWDTHQIHAVACSSRYARYRPTDEDGGGVSFLGLQEMNPNVFAWVTVFGTSISYPVVQGRDNMQYVHQAVDGSRSLAGAIFLDYRTPRDFSHINNVIHGHMMRGNIMFSELHYMRNWDYFYERRYGTLFFDGREHGIEFFMYTNVHAHEREIYRPFVRTDEHKQHHIDALLEMAIHLREDVEITINDRLIILSTCQRGAGAAGADGASHRREVFVGRLIDYVPEDPFYIPEGERPALPMLARIDSLPNMWAILGDWGQFIIMSALFLSLFVGSVIFIGKKSVAAFGIIFLLTIVFSQTANANDDGYYEYNPDIFPVRVAIPIVQEAPDGLTIDYMFTPILGEGLEDIEFSLTGDARRIMGPFNVYRPGRPALVFEVYATSPDRPNTYIDRNRFRIEVTVFADGRTYTTVYIYDGDGVWLKIEEMPYYEIDGRIFFGAFFVHEEDDEPEPPPPPPPPQPPTPPQPPIQLPPQIPQPPPPHTPQPPSPQLPLVPRRPQLPIVQQPPEDLPPPHIPQVPLPDAPPGFDPQQPPVVYIPAVPPWVSPQTGDNNSPVLWIVMFVSSSIMMVILAIVSGIRTKRRKKLQREIVH